MATNLPKGTQIIGTTALPINLAAAPGPLAIWTWTHNKGVAAAQIAVLNADGQALPPSVVAVTQPTVNQIVVTNLSGAPVAVRLMATWVVESMMAIAPAAASVGVIS